MTDPQVSRIEDLTVSDWSLSHHPPVSFRENTLRSMSDTHWDRLRTISGMGLTSLDDMIRFVSILRISSNFRLLPSSVSESIYTGRMLLAFGVLQCVVAKQQVGQSRPEIKEYLRRCACDLIVIVFAITRRNGLIVNLARRSAAFDHPGTAFPNVNDSPRLVRT